MLVWLASSYGMAQTPTLPRLGVAEVTQAINASCFGVQVEGACSCSGNAPDCVVVSYYVPTQMVSLVKHPEHELLGNDVRALMTGDASLQGESFPFGGSGGVHHTIDGVRTHHFWDAQVYTLPASLVQASSPAAFATSCLCEGGNEVGTLHYDSRVDLTWRRDLRSVPGELLDKLPLGGPLGIWGRLSPLNGFIVHVSEPAAAAAIATRAMHAAINPAHGRRILTPALPGAEGCIQPGWPQRKPCMRPGTNPFQWEYNALDHTQSALFFFWSERRCCVKPEQLSCAQALGGGGGGYGPANVCPYPLLPGGLAPGLAPDIGDFIDLREAPAASGAGG